MTEDWYDETFEDENRFSLRVSERLFSEQSPFQHVEVIATPSFGRVLVIDGVFMTSEADEFLYHEMIAHPALVTAPSIERVLIIGGGDGGTAREVLRHQGVKELVMIEIDPVVVEASKKYLPTIGTAWDDPRFDLRIGDGIAYVRDSSDPPFDVVLLDGTDPIGPGEGLFNLDFYRGVRRMLKPAGVFALQSESPLLTPKLFREIQDTLQQVFQKVHPYLGPVPLYGAGQWSWTFASDLTEPLLVVPGRQEALGAGLKAYNAELHQAAFVLPNYAKPLAKS